MGGERHCWSWNGWNIRSLSQVSAFNARVAIVKYPLEVRSIGKDAIMAKRVWSEIFGTRYNPKREVL